ncbi:hypothetical protein K1T71_006355 [Dendrolimus kikuchii]|uniref:Uncharacterized protein n=1 Tax=Dendrolimus kikuchii TaxID=765133 RepID=A0ACC1D3U8_9NEOP|nr:hypothetical protein K1T71_006355 [Dendrolimus kikuchii]
MRLRGKNKKNRAVKRKANSSDTEEELETNVVVTGKRSRKTLVRDQWCDSESENEDPYATDESEEWQPTSDFTETQDY